MLKRLLRFIAEYFVFVGGFMLIFVIGVFYAYIRSMGIIFNAIFLVIVIGWVIYLIKYFWEILDKDKKT